MIGLVGSRLLPEAFRPPRPTVATSAAPIVDALLDRQTPAHTRPSASRALRVAAIGLALWWVPIAALVWGRGPGDIFTQIALFFSKLAVVTFGGAYAVLAYMAQQAVESYGWLAPGEMLDGLGMAETTPGPLIMVVAFVGFVGAWTKEVFGPEALALAGAAGAVVATVFTFLPSFLFIFAGAPFVETTHGQLRFTAPLTGITAAVVGVVVNLAVFFAWHVLWPHGFDGAFDWISAAIGAAAFFALLRLKLGVMTVVGASALAGLAVAFGSLLV